MPQGTNATLLTLIPKTEQPATIKDFRPIACCNVIYKVISKILANRLKTILSDAIELNQSAFVKGRLLLENVCLATELVKDYHKKTISTRCAMKLDISKAFDSLNWDFIIKVLHTMGLPDLFVSWIYGCISTASFSISLNGVTAGYFTSSRGLRQGCVLSPYLFDISINVLSLMINHAASLGHIGYHPLCADVHLTHLSFADDLLIFTDATLETFAGINTVLHSFAGASGLHIKPTKSSTYFGGDPDPVLQQWMSGSGISIDELPVRYLGLPLTTKSMTNSDYQPLIDKVRHRLTAWTTRSLSYAGRLQLIKSVIASITNFWCSAFRLPQRCLDKIEQMCGAFLWSGSLTVSTKAKVAWEEVCKPKFEGGLGIRRLRDVSLVFSFHLIWRLLKSGRSLWVIWTRHYLLRYTSFWDIRRNTRGSWMWNKLLKLRPLIRPYIAHQVRDGLSTYFWTDVWLGSVPLIDRLEEASPRILGISREATVSAVVANGTWRLRLHRRLDIREVITEILALNPPSESNGPDDIQWRNGDTILNSFNASTVWNQLRRRSATVPRGKVVWFSYAIPRYSFITWLAVWDRLGTGSRSAIWGHYQACTFCGDPTESRDHLFFACHYSFTVWETLGQRLIGPTITPGWTYTLNSLIASRRSKNDNTLYRLLFQTTIYHLWRERNNRIHGQPLLP